MTRELSFVLATTAAIAAVPQIAHASCSGGDACLKVTFANNKFTNTDKVRPIRVTGCFLQANGSCAASANFDITIDFNSSKSVTPPPALGSNVKVDVKTAAFVGGLTQPHTATIPAAPTSGPGTLITQEFSTVTVNNTGKIPLKVVILDMGRNDIGRSTDYKLGSIPPITLKKPVSKYHWEVFAFNAKVPCQIGHDETKSSFDVQCQPPRDDVIEQLRFETLKEERNQAVETIRLLKNVLDTLQKDLKDLQQGRSLSEADLSRKDRLEKQIKDTNDRMKTAQDHLKKIDATFPNPLPEGTKI
jgi:hypothetical protein